MLTIYKLTLEHKHCHKGRHFAGTKYETKIDIKNHQSYNLGQRKNIFDIYIGFSNKCSG